jgi:hypothetical protein
MNFRLLFFAVVRFSPPSLKAEAAKRKAEAKNIRRIRKSRSLIFWLRPRAKPEAALGYIMANYHYVYVPGIALFL